MKAAKFANAKMVCAVLKRVSAKNAIFVGTDLSYADLFCGEFLGARFDGANTFQIRNLQHAFFWWYMPIGGGKPSYIPKPGHERLMTSYLGNLSLQENSARQPWEEHD